MVFPLRPEESTFLYKICIFATLNDDNAMHWPALKKNPFSSFSCSSIGTDFGSKRPPRDQIAPVSPTAGLCRKAGAGEWSGAGARAVPLKQISLFPFCINENIISPCLFPGVCSPDSFVLAIKCSVTNS